MRHQFLAGFVVLAGLLGFAPANSAASVPSEPLAPANYVPPSIAGSAAAGSTVLCSPGYWLNTPDIYVYTWQRDGTTTISGPSADNDYTLTASDVGQLITCTVYADNFWGSSTATSSPIVPVTPPVAGAPVNESPPAIVGSAAVGETVDCSPGSWLNNPSGYSYSWQRNGSAIAGQASDQYTLTPSDFNQVVTCEVVASNQAGASVPAVSPPVIPDPGYGTDSSGPNGAGSGFYTGPDGIGGGEAATTRGRSDRNSATTLEQFTVSTHSMLITRRGARRRTRGLTFRFALDRKAQVVIAIERQLPGRRVRRRCRPLTRRSKGGARCSRYRVVQVLALMAKAGNGRLWFSGRSASGLLAPGRYRAVAIAQTPAGWSKPRSVRFVVVGPRS